MRYTVDTDKAYQMIRDSGGKIFYVEYWKKDGSRRRMTARIGVTKGVNGEGLKFSPKAYELACVFDMDKRAWRMINLDAIIRLRVNKYELTVTEEVAVQTGGRK